MEIVDNLIMVVIPGALHAGLGDLLFWGSLSFSLSIAFLFAVPVNRWLIARGKGHVAVHETGVHGGPPARLVGAITIFAFVFGLSRPDRGFDRRGICATRRAPPLLDCASPSSSSPVL